MPTSRDYIREKIRQKTPRGNRKRVLYDETANTVQRGAVYSAAYTRGHGTKNELREPRRPDDLSTARCGRSAAPRGHMQVTHTPQRAAAVRLRGAASGVARVVTLTVRSTTYSEQQQATVRQQPTAGTAGAPRSPTHTGAGGVSISGRGTLTRRAETLALTCSTHVWAHPQAQPVSHSQFPLCVVAPALFAHMRQSAAATDTHATNTASANATWWPRLA